MNSPANKIVKWALIIPAIIFFYASLFLIIKIWYPAGLTATNLKLHLIHFSIIFVLWMIILYTNRAFDVYSLRTIPRLFLGIISSLMIGLITAITYFYVQPNLALTPRRFLLSLALLSFALVFLWQLMIRYITGQHFIEQLYLLGLGAEQDEIFNELEKYKFLGIRVAGQIDESDLELFELPDHARLVIPDSHKMTPELLKQLYDLRSRSIVFYNYRTLYESLSRKVYLGSLNEIWFLENINYRRRKLYHFVKRIIDIIIGLIGLLLLGIVYIPIVILIKLTSKGPVFHKQPRIGQYGTIFIVYKLRTMTTVENPGNTWTAKGDQRITLIGAFLRRTRLDELPQAINLLRGDMSLVGPRPEQPHIVKQLRDEIPFYDERHVVKPGITGWGQLNVYARTVEESKIKLQYDLYYIKHRSFLFDLEIILKTFYHVLTSSDT